MGLTTRQWQNAAARTAVWAVFFALWVQLQKPAGASLAAVRFDALGAAGAILALGGLAVLLWSVMTLAGSIEGDARLTAPHPRHRKRPGARRTRAVGGGPAGGAGNLQALRRRIRRL
jgi:hypothetical protein